MDPQLKAAMKEILDAISIEELVGLCMAKMSEDERERVEIVGGNYSERSIPWLVLFAWGQEPVTALEAWLDSESHDASGHLVKEYRQ
jgi:hypothetical protein